MARIRSTKPEFWTRPDVLELSIPAIMLYQGMENFADDNGNIEGHHKSIKTKIFPDRDVDVDALIEELLAQKMLKQYTVNGVNYYNLCSFSIDQKIDKRAQPRCPLNDAPPLPPIPPDSPRLPPTEGKGREGKGKEVKTQSDKPDLEDFEIRWKRYKGEKDGKKLAKGFFNSQFRSQKDLADYDKAEQNYYAIVEADFDGRRLKSGKVWFNNWRDYIDQEPEKAEVLDPRDDPLDKYGKPNPLYEPNRNGGPSDKSILVR